jgi:hypothetical protein
MILMGLSFTHGPLSLTLSHEGRGDEWELVFSSLPWRERVRERGKRNAPITFNALNY